MDDIVDSIEVEGYAGNFPVTVSVDKDKDVELWDAESNNFLMLSANGARQLLAWLSKQQGLDNI